MPVGPRRPLRPRRAILETLARLGRYTAVRAVTLFLTVVVGVYLTILIANMGGYVDQIRRATIREEIVNAVAGNPDMQQLSTEDLQRVISQQVRIEEERIGLDRPFALRSLGYLSDALTLDLGRAQQLESDSGSRHVRLILLERLPPTLLLFATANLLLFVISVFIALHLSRRYGSTLDKAVIALAPSSAAPSWFYGIFFILLFAAVLRVLPFGGMVDAPPPETTWGYTLSVLEHLILPVTAIVVSAVFQTSYSWRTFFLIYSSEDYVEMAKAKGLAPGAIERRYVLRPTLPTIVTSFALTLISLWTGSIILETVFSWPGLGRLFIRAIGAFDTPVIVGVTVTYGYLLALTVFILDIVYVLIDPRVKVGLKGGGA